MIGTQKKTASFNFFRLQRIKLSFKIEYIKIDAKDWNVSQHSLSKPLKIKLMSYIKTLKTFQIIRLIL